MATKIEWVRNPDGTKGETWNPVSGCSKVSPGCKNCYAERMAKRLAGRFGYPEVPHQFNVTLHPDKLDLPLRWKKPRMVFVCSMSDLFHIKVSQYFVEKVFRIIAQCPQHTFQILTKRPKRMAEYMRYMPHHLRASGFSDDLSNVWCGVTAENQAAADERIPLLLQTPAAVRFVSCEPLLGAVDLVKAASIPAVWDTRRFLTNNLRNLGLHWLICGGESGPGARPMHPDWVRSLRDQCQSSGVPFFFKQWGRWVDYHNASTETKDWLDRGQYHDGYAGFPDQWNVFAVGKKAAGRLLDGRIWDEMPER